MDRTHHAPRRGCLPQHVACIAWLAVRQWVVRTKSSAGLSDASAIRPAWDISWPTYPGSAATAAALSGRSSKRLEQPAGARAAVSRSRQVGGDGTRLAMAPRGWMATGSRSKYGPHRHRTSPSVRSTTGPAPAAVNEGWLDDNYEVAARTYCPMSFRQHRFQVDEVLDHQDHVSAAERSRPQPSEVW